MPKITTFLTYDHQAEEAARFYTSIFPKSKIHRVTKYLDGTPMPAGTVMTVEFTLDGQEYVALNGGPSFKFTEAVSLYVDCKNQEEIDHYWEALSAGGEEIMCGWLRDKFGMYWQVDSHRVTELMADSDREKAQRAFNAMMKMKKIVIADVENAAEGAAARH